MVTDHSRAGDKLKGIAATKNLTLPGSMDAKDKALYDRLSGLSGEAFDKAYMQAMVKDHVQDVADFARNPKRPRIRMSVPSPPQLCRRSKITCVWLRRRS